MLLRLTLRTHGRYDSPIMTTPPTRERATELEYLTWFRHEADFGPAHSDVVERMHYWFMEKTGKNLPEGWNVGQDGETCLDR